MPVVTKQTVKKTASKKTVVKQDDDFLSGIMSVADLEQTGYKFLIYGLSGTGKTRLACSFPKPALVIRPEKAEDGTMSVRHIPGVEATPYMTHADQLNTIVEMQKAERKYKTMILDGVTKFQDLVLKKVLDLSEVPEQLSWGIATQQTWGIVSNELKQYIRNLLQLTEMGTHIVITGGERGLNTEENQAALLAPSVMIALTPSSMGWLHEVCDYNVHTFIRRKRSFVEKIVGGKKIKKEVQSQGCEFCLAISPHEVYQIKFRVSGDIEIPEVMVNPTFDKLNKLIQGV